MRRNVPRWTFPQLPSRAAKCGPGESSSSAATPRSEAPARGYEESLGSAFLAEMDVKTFIRAARTVLRGMTSRRVALNHLRLREKGIDGAGHRLDETRKTAAPQSRFGIKASEIDGRIEDEFPRTRRPARCERAGTALRVEYLFSLRICSSMGNGRKCSRLPERAGRTSRQGRCLRELAARDRTGRDRSGSGGGCAARRRWPRIAVADEIRPACDAPAHRGAIRSKQFRKQRPQRVVEALVRIDVEAPGLRALLERELLLPRVAAPWLLEEPDRETHAQRSRESARGYRPSIPNRRSRSPQATQALDAIAEIPLLVLADDIAETGSASAIGWGNPRFRDVDIAEVLNRRIRTPR